MNADRILFFSICVHPRPSADKNAFSARSKLRRPGRSDAQLRGAELWQRRVDEEQAERFEPAAGGVAGHREDEAAGGPGPEAGGAPAARAATYSDAETPRFFRHPCA